MISLCFTFLVQKCAATLLSYNFQKLSFCLTQKQKLRISENYLLKGFFQIRAIPSFSNPSLNLWMMFFTRKQANVTWTCEMKEILLFFKLFQKQSVL